VNRFLADLRRTAALSPCSLSRSYEEEAKLRRWRQSSLHGLWYGHGIFVTATDFAYIDSQGGKP
jgi:hypothetical protein